MDSMFERDVTRRSALVAGGALAAAAIAGGTSPRIARADEAEGLAWDYEADVVVCGCGTGGVAAAVAAADGGAEVIVIEKKDWLGGQLRRCGGGVAAAGSQVQKALGVEDNADDFYAYWMAMQDDLCDADLVRDICDNSAAIIDWLIDDLGGQPLDQWGFSEGIEGGLTYSPEPGLNIGTQPENFEAHGMTPVARCHWFSPNPDDPIIGEADKQVCPNPGGTGLWKIFSDAFEERGVQTMTETSLVSLVTQPGSNEVLGIVADQGGTEIKIKARRGVVVCTGNFCSNHEMFFNYTNYDFTAEEGCGNGPTIDLPDDNDGAGIKAVLALGGELVFPANGVTDNEDGTAFGYSFMTGGMRVDTQARAIDVFGNPIPRLYLSSNTAGGQIIKSYHCCGVNVLRHLYLGKVAGEQASALDSWEA